MHRAAVVYLVLATSTIADAADSVYPFIDLSSEMSAAETLPEQRAIVKRMREASRDGVVPGRQLTTMIYFLAKEPVFNEVATISFLQDLIATPGTAEAATTAIASQFRGNAFSDSARETFAEELRAYHLQPGLSDEAIANLQQALTRDTPQANREHALAILMLRPPDGDKRGKFLTAVSKLLEAEMSADEKQAAMEIFVQAAETGPLPENAIRAIYRVATAERDAAVRVAAWPLVMRKKFEQRESDRGSHFSLGLSLNQQLLAPVTASKPSFIDADVGAREQAVALLNDYWHPDYHPEYIAILIKLVDVHGSPASMEKLMELRRMNALNGEQLTALTQVAATDPAIAQAVETITIPNLEAGSLMGPTEVIAHSNDPEEWARATEQLLAQHPNGAVPTSAAEAAYTVMVRAAYYDAAAVALFVRGEMPFEERETKVLKLVDRKPQNAGHIVKALQHLHGDVGLDFLVRRYTDDISIDESFRGTLLSMLYVEVRESGQMDAETTAAVTNFARSTGSYSSISKVAGMLELSGAYVPLSIRIRQESFQWRLLSWVGVLSLGVGVVAGLYLPVLVALPGRKSGLRGVQRGIGLVLWLILSALFVGAVLMALLHSIGHGSAPPPDLAFPYYAAVLIISIFLLFLAIALHRQRVIPVKS